MNPCHCHLAVPPFIVEASGVCLTRKLVEIVHDFFKQKTAYKITV